MFYWLDGDDDLKHHIGHRVEVEGDLKGDVKDGEIKTERKDNWTEVTVTWVNRDGATEERDKRTLKLFTSWKPPAGFDFKGSTTMSTVTAGLPSWRPRPPKSCSRGLLRGRRSSSLRSGRSSPVSRQLPFSKRRSLGAILCAEPWRGVNVATVERVEMRPTDTDWTRRRS